MKITVPPSCTAEEVNIWLTGLRMGCGSDAEIARMLKVTPVTLSRWKSSDEDREWWWRDVFNALATRIGTELRTEVVKARAGSQRFNDAKRSLKNMMARLDQLPHDAFDAITPPMALSPAMAAARALLTTELADGPMDQRTLHRKAERAGISPITLHRASARMGVIKRQKGFGSEKRVKWELPPDVEED